MKIGAMEQIKITFHSPPSDLRRRSAFPDVRGQGGGVHQEAEPGAQVLALPARPGGEPLGPRPDGAGRPPGQARACDRRKILLLRNSVV